jgi:hypothetical protein
MFSVLYFKIAESYVNCFNFWVYPQRLVYIGRRFGTQRKFKIKNLMYFPKFLLLTFRFKRRFPTTCTQDSFERKDDYDGCRVLHEHKHFLSLGSDVPMRVDLPSV